MSQSETDRLTVLAAERRIPLYGMLELTWRCNFRCVHCYQDGLRDRHRELTAAEWKQVMDELAQLGCTFLTLTGGDPLVRRDFPEIYAHAIERGFVVTVFTNGALIDESAVALWTRLPPRKIEISLYGATAEKYREVTGQPEGYARAVSAIDRLTAAGIRVELKAPAMRQLIDDLPAMASFASARGLEFRFDPGLFPRLDGNRAPLAYRLTPGEIVDLESKQPGFMQSVDACFADVPDLGSRVYRCGAGSNAFNVDPSGHFEACAISRATSLDWRELGATAAWAGLAPEAAQEHEGYRFADLQPPGKAENCGGCAARGGCSRCPGKSWLESGDVQRAVPHHCEVSAKKILWRESA